jgi:DNA repair protein RadC
VLEIAELYRGSLNSAPVRIAEVFKPAIRRNAAALILVHNHPSGDPAPSPDDIALTKGIREAGRLLDIELLDHLVIGQGRFISMKEKRLGF